jgi:hypothetical protein
MAQIHGPAPTEPTTPLVAARFVLRLAILCLFSLLSRRGFGPAFSALLLMASTLCSVIATLRRERVMASILTHWDEAAAYALLYGAVQALAF